MIVVERLNPSEWDLLKVGGEGFVPDPEHSIAVVARNNSQIVGRAFLVPLVHLEGTHIESNWRNGSVLAQLMDAVEVEARAEGLKKLFAYSRTNLVDSYLERLKYKHEPMKLYAKELGELPSQR